MSVRESPAPSLLVRPSPPDAEGTILRVTPGSAGWSHVSFEVLVLAEGSVARRETGGQEACIVVVSGSVTIESSYGGWRELGTRQDPWSGLPEAAYLPPGSDYSITGEGGGAEVALCLAPAPGGGAEARILPGAEIVPERRGYGSQERTIHPILMGERPAESLLVCEVLTPPGHWSSYPPHKHDRDDPPAETLLEETYYHRIAPPQGFALQRVYTDDRSLDTTLTVGDRDCVLVPRGYHTVSAPPGYALYYLNVMAGPSRLWAVANDPDHAWTLEPPAAAG
jgi:5-deoxy-glucuronate isomerase